MRLNLQLLLAYLDDLLEPAESAHVVELLEASETAPSLLNRIRDVTRRLRLSAPAVSGSEMGLDPNTVAEYLDRTMPAERLADVEGVCLESDMHLAEVAACHQIVALAMGEPAQVDAASRRRMYGLVAEPAPAKPALATAAKSLIKPARTTPAAKPAAAEPRPEAPRAREKVPLVAATPRAAKHEIPAPAFSTTIHWQEEAAAPQVPREVRSSPPRHLFRRMAIAMTLAWGALAGWPHAARWWEGPQGVESADARYEEFPEVEPAAPGERHRPVEVAAAPDSGDPPGTEGPGTSQPVEIPRDPSGAPLSSTSPIAGPRPRALTRGHEADSPPSPPGGAQQVSFHLPTGPNEPVREIRPAVAMRPVGPVEKPAGVVEVGQVVSTGQVILRQGPERGEWLPLSSGARISSGDRLVAPPQFRPTILLGDGLLVELPPETMVELLAPDSDDTPGLKVLYGRLVVRGHQRSRGLRISAAAWQAKLAFEGETGSLAVEVRPFRSAGTEPEKETARSAVDVYAVRGRAFVDDGVSLGSLDAPSRTVISKLPGERVEAGGDTPAWSHAPETFTVEDLRATTIVSGRLSAGEPAVGALVKAAIDRQHPEVRQLAARWLGCLGEFQALVASLSDPDLRPGLREQSVRALRDGLARGPEWATLVRVACRQCRGEAGDDRYRLLWGFTPEQMSEGAAERLLAGLDHNDLDVRVLSFWNLQTHTGHSLYYRPEQPASQRRQSIERWKERLSRGQNAGD
jgi:hypothetical protein